MFPRAERRFVKDGRALVCIEEIFSSATLFGTGTLVCCGVEYEKYVLELSKDLSRGWVCLLSCVTCVTDSAYAREEFKSTYAREEHVCRNVIRTK